MSKARPCPVCPSWWNDRSESAPFLMPGLAMMPALSPGEYTVSGIDARFCSGAQGGGGDPRIGQTVRVIFTLRIQVSETITVTAEVPMVDVYKSIPPPT